MKGRAARSSGEARSCSTRGRWRCDTAMSARRGRNARDRARALSRELSRQRIRRPDVDRLARARKGGSPRAARRSADEKARRSRCASCSKQLDQVATREGAPSKHGRSRGGFPREKHQAADRRQIELSTYSRVTHDDDRPSPAGHGSKPPGGERGPHAEADCRAHLGRAWPPGSRSRSPTTCAPRAARRQRRRRTRADRAWCAARWPKSRGRRVAGPLTLGAWRSASRFLLGGCARAGRVGKPRNRSRPLLARDRAAADAPRRRGSTLRRQAAARAVAPVLATEAPAPVPWRRPRADGAA